MFKLQLKLKPGNVFQKINKMDKKQAYTWGAIIVVCFIALVTLASFMGDAEDASFDGFNTRGYDLAQMPFVNDEAEEYLLASKYPDMQNNGSTMLYSQQEKEARQEADAEATAEENGGTEEASSSSDSSESYRGYSGRGYSGGAGAGTGAPTQVGQLGAASMGHAGGSGMSGSFGAPRGDFSPYKSQEKGSEIPVQLKNTDARRALAQFAQTSRAAAGLRDNKNANAKRALMGGSVKGSEAFTDSGVDLSKTGGLALDTNAPVSSADLGNLDKAVSDSAKKGKDNKDKALQDLQNLQKESFWEQLGRNLLVGFANAGIQAGIGAAFDGLADARANYVGNKAVEQAGTDMYNSLGTGLDQGQMEALSKLAKERNWGDPAEYFKAHDSAKVSDFIEAEGRLAPTRTATATIRIGEDNTEYFQQQLNDAAAQTNYEIQSRIAELRVGANKQAFMDAYKSSTSGRDVYNSARASSRENNFFAGSFAQTFQGVLGSSLNQAVNVAIGGENTGGGYNYNYNNGGSGRSSSRSAGNGCPSGYYPKTTTAPGAGGYGTTTTTECVKIGD